VVPSSRAAESRADHRRGLTREVAFEPVNDAELGDRIDEAYRAKYAKSPYLKPMIGQRAKAATVRIVPR
jgi:hypothetical protein